MLFEKLDLISILWGRICPWSDNPLTLKAEINLNKKQVTPQATNSGRKFEKFHSNQMFIIIFPFNVNQQLFSLH